MGSHTQIITVIFYRWQKIIQYMTRVSKNYSKESFVSFIAKIFKCQLTRWEELTSYTSFFIIEFIRDFCSALTNPDQAGEAYNNLAKVVALTTSCNLSPLSPWAVKNLIAYIDCFALEVIYSICGPNPSLSFNRIPSMLIMSTL